MEWRTEWKPLALIAAIFLGVYYLPVEATRVEGPLAEALYLARWYAREHVLLCLVPAFFIAGAISVFVSKPAVMKYLGPKAPKGVAYGVASVSGTVLLVCSCTVLPLFAGIYRMGAGLGPACAFLYSGPAINILAIILTARILGPELGIARAVGAVLFSVVVGLLMYALFRGEETKKAEEQALHGGDEPARPLWQNAVYFAVLGAILVFANWSRPAESAGLWAATYGVKWVIVAIAAVALGALLVRWLGLPGWKVLAVAAPTALVAAILPGQPTAAFVVGAVGLSVITSTSEGEAADWFWASWEFAKQILPLLLFGVLVAGALLGRPEHEGLIPSAWVASAVGGNSLGANLFASAAGAFMYFATLTELPILQGLIGSGMGQGPALALLLAGPALSLPSMLVIRSILGTRKTAVFVVLVVIMATISGMLFGAVAGTPGAA